MSKPDIINHPPHYKGSNGVETIEVIEGFDLDFHLGNAVKYILRCGKKSDDTSSVTIRVAAKIEDLKKARWYIDRVIADRERALEFWQKIDRKIARDNRRFTKRRRKHAKDE